MQMYADVCRRILTCGDTEALGFIVLYGLYLYAAIYGSRVSEAVLAAAGVQVSVFVLLYQ
jgi:hypothetical protein